MPNLHFLYFFFPVGNNFKHFILIRQKLFEHSLQPCICMSILTSFVPYDRNSRIRHSSSLPRPQTLRYTPQSWWTTRSYHPLHWKSNQSINQTLQVNPNWKWVCLHDTDPTIVTKSDWFLKINSPGFKSSYRISRELRHSPILNLRLFLHSSWIL